MGDIEINGLCTRVDSEAGKLMQATFLQDINDNTLLPSIYKFKIVSKIDLLLHESRLKFS